MNLELILKLQMKLINAAMETKPSANDGGLMQSLCFDIKALTEAASTAAQVQFQERTLKNAGC